MLHRALRSATTVVREVRRLYDRSVNVYRDGGLTGFYEKLWWYVSNSADVLVNAFLGRVVEAVVGKDEDLWVFGGTYNGDFAQNAKYLFLYVVEKCDDVTPVWVTWNRGVVEELRDAGYRAHHVHSLAGLRTLLRAAVVFYTNNLGNYGALWGLTGGATRVNLWHGNPIKRFPYSWQMTWRRDADLVVVTSSDRSLELFSEVAWTLSPKSRFEAEQAVPSGYPRNDVLFREVPGFMTGLDEDVYERVRGLSDERQVVGYFPTYRPYEDRNPLMTAESLDRVHGFLKDADAQLILKPHHSETLPADVDGYEHFTVLPPNFDIYPVLDAIDVLITDYSSVYFGFLLLDRPIVLFPYDLDRYREENGLAMDYDELAGPVTETVDELLAHVGEALEGTDEHRDDRQAVRARFYDDVDGGASARICDAVRGRTG